MRHDGIGVDQLLVHRLGTDGVQVQAPAVIAGGDAQAAPIVDHVDADLPGRGLALGNARQRRFQAVVQRIAQQVHEDVLQRRGRAAAQAHARVGNGNARRLLVQFQGQRGHGREHVLDHGAQALGAQAL